MKRFAHAIRGSAIPPITEASFWALIDFNLLAPCWPWQGVTGLGYGRFKVGRFRYSAHRLAYALAYGYCPAELVVRHTCDNKLCCAPHHLILGTDAENIKDRDDRGRTAKGSRSGGAILNDAAVRLIRLDSRPRAVVAATHGVRPTTISKIRARSIWKHVQEVA